MRTANDLKRDNVSSILHIIRESGAISKNQLAYRTELSQVTVHKIVNELTAQGICLQSEDKLSTGGRNAALYTLNSRYGCIVGQTLYRHRVMTVAYDFSLAQLYFAEIDNDMTDMSNSVTVMMREIHKAMDALKGWRFLGIGVALPGRSNLQGVVVHIPGISSWNHVPLRDILRDEFSLPVCVDNDNNALAVSAKYNRLCDRFTDYTYMQIFEGIGVGAVIDDKLFRGHNGCGCEIGHTSIMLGGPLCACGNHGCLEAFLCNSHLLTCISAKCSVGDVSAPENIDQAIEQARANPDSAAAGVFSETARYIAVAVEHIYRIFDTQAVIIRCTWLSAFPHLFQQVVNTVFLDFPWVRRDRFFILLDEDEGIRESAAACIFLENFYVSAGLTGCQTYNGG